MGRIYAGVLGPLAFLTVTVRGLVHGSVGGDIMLMASLCLFGFALVGYVSGELAGWIIEDSVRTQITAEVAAAEQEAKPTATAART